MTTRSPHEASVPLFGLRFAKLTMGGVVDSIASAMEDSRGGVVLTANLDILRRASRDEAARAIYVRADLVVADGMPIVWAYRLAGTPLPERVAGSTLLIELCRSAAAAGRSVYLLGGDGDDARLAADALRSLEPSLRVAGVSSPKVSMPISNEEVAELAELLRAASPDLVFVALGSPKQEALGLALRALLPSAWFVGVGGSFAFLAGRVKRAHPVLQRAGLEWAHRLSQEPGRLARRYLVEGLPFAAEVFGKALFIRVFRARS